MKLALWLYLPSAPHSIGVFYAVGEALQHLPLGLFEASTIQ